MSNALTRAGQALRLSEKRIVMLAVSKLDPRQQPAAPQVTQITAAEYAATFSVDPDTAYDQLREGAKHLYQRTITFYEPAHRRDGAPLEPTEVNMRWVGEARYRRKEGYIELHWWHRIVPHLMGLKRQFTTYQLQQATALRSIYSWRLLELLMRYQSTGWAEYTIEDFCTAMDATEKQKANFNNIRRRIIEPAVAELTGKDEWLIQWRPITAGRRVRAVRFDFARHPQARLPF